MNKNGLMVTDDGALASFEDCRNFEELNYFFRIGVVPEIEWEGKNDMVMREGYGDLLDDFGAHVIRAQTKAVKFLEWRFNSYLLRALELGVSGEELEELKQTLRWSEERVLSAFPSIEEEPI